jgi:hypothetical protein
VPLSRFFALSHTITTLFCRGGEGWLGAAASRGAPCVRASRLLSQTSLNSRCLSYCQSVSLLVDVAVAVSEEEKAGWELLPPEERPAYVPQAFDCLRHVPLYSDFIKERFERCLDLYLCPRCVQGLGLGFGVSNLTPSTPNNRIAAASVLVVYV